MKVLNIIGEMGYGGAELLTFALAKGLSAKGVGASIAVIGFCEPEVVEAIEEAGVDFHHFNAHLLSPWNIVRICQLIKKGNFDQVHAHLFPCLYWAASAKLFCSSRVRWIYTEHSTHNRRRNQNWLAPVESQVYKSYHKIVCISNGAQAALSSFIPDLKTMRVIENGVDVEKYRNAEAVPRESLGLAEDDIVVFMAGAFREEKNQRRLVACFRFLPDNYKLVLAGNGPELERVKNLVKTEGLEPRVIFLGTSGTVEKLMKMSDVYVLPSLFEGFGLSAVEAAAASLPIVYAQVSGLGELFEGVGVPVNPLSEKSIAEGILHITGTQTLQSECSRKSLTLARKYDFQHTLDNYFDLYYGDV